MSLKHLMQRITSLNEIDIPDAQYLRVPAGEIRAAIAEADALRRERDELETVVIEVAGEIGCEPDNEKMLEGVHALRRERDELAARLAEIEAQPPVAWDCEYRSGERLLSYAKDPMTDSDCMAAFPLVPRPAPAAAPERADGCGACGDSCRSRGSCRLADESPRPAARPCRCGPDKCPDSVACPKGGAA